MLEQGDIGLSALQSVFGLPNFARGRRTFLLQTPVSIETALGRDASTAGFDELGIESNHFFLSATGGELGLVGLRGCYLSFGAGGLGAYIVVVELQQKLPFAYMVALLDQQALNRRRDGSVRFEVSNGFDLAIGGDDAADRTALDSGRPNFQGSLVKIVVEHPQDN